MSDEKQTLVKDDSVEADDAVKTREAAEQAQALDKLTDKVIQSRSAFSFVLEARVAISHLKQPRVVASVHSCRSVTIWESSWKEQV